jgi:hypothetical protein
MIDWLLANQPHFVRYSRWILAVCAAGLLGISRLPRSPVDRVIAIVGLAVVALLFGLWLMITLVTIMRPQAFTEMRRRRTDAAALRDRRGG